MSTLLITHPACRDHATPPGHPEAPARLDAALAALDGPRFADLLRAESPDVSDADLLRGHPRDWVDRLAAMMPAQGSVALDPDTHASPGTWTAARRAAGAACAAVDAVIAGQAGNAFVLTRPPGHHAERTRTMGFCLFGNVAIAAKRALDHHGLERVAVVDFDVHHGNGTQDLLWDEARVRFVSSHQSPLWPGTGDASETGAHGQITNIPLPPGSDGRAMWAAYEAQVFPMLEDFAPELLLISAGFDAHIADPLANLNWRTDDFRRLTDRLCAIAARHAGGRVVSVLEGGYDLDALADCVAAHVTVLMEHSRHG